MPNSDSPSPHPLRKIFLTVEFSCLALLLGSMGWFSRQSAGGEEIAPVWLLVPAIASLGVFLSFIGLMYLRWVATAEGANLFRNKVIFSFLAVTLIGVWLYGIANTWHSLNVN
ncbi:MAG: hypothetical protein EP339_02255 [Gammaproteobacteria bacterium]|nr:hypothetical protein [Marinobacter nitratireducens]TNE81236.1 MAG: hypothetical protein EP339_02255 [Gammaproteobacteria bacterium]TNE95993.1 MAG: hypothetical protein EP328_08905 [Gammaproteobacteria bacterium]